MNPLAAVLLLLLLANVLASSIRLRKRKQEDPARERFLAILKLAEEHATAADKKIQPVSPIDEDDTIHESVQDEAESDDRRLKRSGGGGLTVIVWTKAPVPSLAPVANIAVPTAPTGPSPTKMPVPDPTKAPVPEPTRAPAPEPTRAPAPEPTRAPAPEPTTPPVPEPTSPPVPPPTDPPVDPPTEPPVDPPTDPPVLTTPAPVFPTHPPGPSPTHRPVAQPVEEPATDAPVELQGLAVDPTTPEPTPNNPPIFMPTPPPADTGRTCPTDASELYQALYFTAPNLIQPCDVDADCATFKPQDGPACCAHPQCICVTLYERYEEDFQCVNF